MMSSEMTYFVNWGLDNKILTIFLAITVLVWLNSTRILNRSYNKLIKDLRELRDAVESVKVGNGKETHEVLDSFFEVSPENTFQYYRPLFKTNVAGIIGRVNESCGSDLLYDVLSFDNIEATHMSESSMSFYRSLLISIGVIGTFAGLIVGIDGASEGLASTDSATARLSLQDLLSGAGLAFITSIAGLSFSTLFGIQHQKKFNAITSAHSRFLLGMKCRIIPRAAAPNINSVRVEIEKLIKVTDERLEGIYKCAKGGPTYYMHTLLKEQNNLLTKLVDRSENR
jgi:hypothetical protein